LCGFLFYFSSPSFSVLSLPALTSTRINALVTKHLSDPEIAGLEWVSDYPLAQATTMGVGPVADALAVAHDDDGLAAFLKTAHAQNWRVAMLGGGSNTVFCGERFEGVVLRLGHEYTEASFTEPDFIDCGSAAPMGAFVRKASDANLSGAEFCMGIPGCVGGALAGNAGQRGEWICSLVDYVRGFTWDGKSRTIKRGEFDFGYRYSELSKIIVTFARFVLKASDASAIRTKLNEFLSVRKEQPLGVRSSGCIFKNPEGDSAGRLIDAAGLKGYSIGGAEVSTLHANFIVNRNAATSRDIESLIDHIRATVKDRFGVELQLEVRLVH